MVSLLARDPARRCLTVREWPEPDRALWLNAMQPGDLLEPGGTRARHAASSNHAVEGGYGRFLAWLDHRGQLDRALQPAARISADVVGDYLQALAAVNSTATQLRRLEELYIAATVMRPDDNWQWIRDLAVRVRQRHQPVRDKRSLLVGIDDLEELGFSLMRRADEGPGTPRQRALLYRNGLALALLIARPLRLANFAGLRLGEHLVRRGTDWWLLVPKSETKTGSLIEMPWPVALVAQLETYLATYRLVLVAQQSRYSQPRHAGQALWVSSTGSAMDSQSVYNLIVIHTREAFGRSLSPHLFRDCAATGIAVEDPTHVRMGSPLLGHRSHITMERHYNQAGSIEAARRWQRNLANLRERRQSVVPADR